jgi:hypothetical protein
MTGPEHYREAERLIGNVKREVERATADTINDVIETACVTIAASQVHATLALAAATALTEESRLGSAAMVTRGDIEQWREVTQAAVAP